MFSIIVTTSQLLTALGVIAGVLMVLWKFGKWFYKWAKRIEKTIGTNGGSTIFQQFDLMSKQNIAISDQVAMHSTVVDLIQTPSFAVGPDGEVASVSVPFVLATHMTLEEMQYGGWRSLMSAETRQQWDETVKAKSTFLSTVRIGGKIYEVAARPKFNEGRFVGWRAALESTEALFRTTPRLT